jgi:hypothetical protein
LVVGIFTPKGRMKEMVIETEVGMAWYDQQSDVHYSGADI